MVMSPDKNKQTTKCIPMGKGKVNDKGFTLYSALTIILMKNHNKQNKKAGYKTEDCRF